MLSRQDATRQAKAPAAKLNRAAFSTSRLLDFFSEKELVAQMGHQRREWPLVLVKELLDNAIDACEEKGIAPKISLTVDERGITVIDNGPGIPPAVVKNILDYSVRVSSREAYVSPSRGQQGNALKTVLAMPFVLSGDTGLVEIVARGIRHTIHTSVDRIRQQPQIKHEEAKVPKKPGTSVFVAWPNSPSDLPRSNGHSENNGFLQNGDEPDDSDDTSEPVSPRLILARAKSRFLQIADDFTWTNPHLGLTVDWHGERIKTAATNAEWSKWRPDYPTDPHWYGAEELDRLIAAYIAHDVDHERERTVREFVAEFHGLTGSVKAKRVLEDVGLSRAKLSDLANGDGIDKATVAKLLTAMQQHTRAVKPPALGIIGSDHIAAKMKAIGAEMESYKYKKVVGVTDGKPWIVETAFAWCPNGTRKRRIVTGVNWSPGIINPFRQMGSYGRSLDTILERQRVGADEPTALFLHLTCPRVQYADRGKSSLVIE